MTKHILIFGLGYTASRLADALKVQGWAVDATGSAGNIDFKDENAVRAALHDASHVLSSVPPDRQSGEDPVLARYGQAFSNHWIGYLSSTGVYGDQQGAWVDESTPTVAETGAGRRNARAEADAAWMHLSARVFRLPGIYGPGRSALDRVEMAKHAGSTFQGKCSAVCMSMTLCPAWSQQLKPAPQQARTIWVTTCRPAATP